MQVYLDNSATTRPSDRVIEAMSQAMREDWYNPSALYRPAMLAQKRVDAVRKDCLSAAGANGQNIIFTGCGTEADNIAILGHMRTVKNGRVLISCIEHPGVLRCAQELERLGHRVEFIPVTHAGLVDLGKLEQLLAPDTSMICVMQVNNETGAIQPIGEIVGLRNRLCPGAAIHVDGVQGFLRVPVDFNKTGIQSYALSGHKIHAPKGIGALIYRRDFKISPIMFGGGQENGYRSGTENTPGIIGLGEAVQSYPHDANEWMRNLKKRLWEGLRDAVPQAVLNGPELDSSASAPHILNVSLVPVRSQTMLLALEGDGIYVSAGSACSSKQQKVSGVLTSMGIPTSVADCALRFSLCPDITEEQIDYTVQMVKKQYELLKKFVRR